jgi:GntR family transcriptional regulator, trigonelline degradation regulator
MARQVDVQNEHAPPVTLRVVRENHTLTRKVGDVLRDAILNGDFDPGQRLVERTLCELTGVSRTAVREALRSLEAEGLVVNVPNRGPTVANVSRAEASDIYVVRSMLEVLAVELFVARATADELAELGSLLDGMNAALAADDRRRTLVLKRRFHAVLSQGSGNLIVAKILEQLYAKIMLLRRLTLGPGDRPTVAVAELRAVFEAIQARDVKAAKKACLAHVLASANATLAALAGENV